MDLRSVDFHEPRRIGKAWQVYEPFGNGMDDRHTLLWAFRRRNSNINFGAAKGFGILNSVIFAVAFRFGFHTPRNGLAIGSLLAGVFCQSIDFGFDGAAD